MTVTYSIVSFGRNAIAIRDDGTFVLYNGGMQPFASLNDLKTGIANTKPYATYEPNFWILDGNYKFAPSSNGHAGWMSTVMSGTGSANFAAPEPEMYIDFSVVHSTSGLKLKFSEFTGDWVDSITISFYNASLVLIRSDTYTPTGTTFSTNQAVSNFKRVQSKINSTNKAQRYARILSIDFDTLTTFSGSAIKAAQLVEQINPLATELPINTVELKLFSADGDFSIVDPVGFYANLQYKEPLDVHENVNGETLYIGRFYLDDWGSETENLATFRASDAIGLMDHGKYLPENTSSFVFDPLMEYFGSDLTAGELIGDIMSQAGMAYELDASLTNIIISDNADSTFGRLPVTTFRKCLQLVLFKIGAYASCARSNVIQIKPFELASDLVAFDYTLTAAQKGLGQPVQLRPLVTGVEITSHDFGHVLAGGGFTDGMTLNLPLGIHVLTYDEPVYNKTVALGTGGFTNISEGSAWWKFNVTTAGTMTFSGILYAHSQINFGVYGSPPAGTPPNIIQITDAILVDKKAATTVAQRVYDYYQQRYLQKTKLFASLIAVGNSVLIDTQSGRQIAGIVERMETDLAGGMISKTDIVGVVV